MSWNEASNSELRAFYNAYANLQRQLNNLTNPAAAHGGSPARNIERILNQMRQLEAERRAGQKTPRSVLRGKIARQKETLRRQGMPESGNKRLANLRGRAAERAQGPKTGGRRRPGYTGPLQFHPSGPNLPFSPGNNLGQIQQSMERRSGAKMTEILTKASRRRALFNGAAAKRRQATRIGRGNAAEAARLRAAANAERAAGEALNEEIENAQAELANISKKTLGVRTERVRAIRNGNAPHQKTPKRPRNWLEQNIRRKIAGAEAIAAAGGKNAQNAKFNAAWYREQLSGLLHGENYKTPPRPVRGAGYLPVNRRSNAKIYNNNEGQGNRQVGGGRTHTPGSSNSNASGNKKPRKK